MVTLDDARRITRIGRLFFGIGGGIGLVLWVVAFSRQVSSGYLFVFVVPMALGLLTSFAGAILERFAKQSDVGRQTRQP
jgi:hypothetical protein